ncbi:UbiA prenyltransferase family protein [Pedobacter aquatilis]|uniref:UbiA prenyltransferase family protein n=1 Tax=Pedobacter aquatilis TaxID=351343 RepID=UPI0025B3A49B|nr:UbiA prenyltransferase family protein [Pedobacter aquatilis]MDN3585388.1 UbiA prenyltransferase family protein [Pedobacter aquatilis]
MIDRIILPDDSLSSDNSSPKELKQASIKEYIAIARPDNWVKNLFMFPGMLFALSIFHTPFNSGLVIKILLGLASICLVASANYVINEYLDAGFDKYHPLKNKRSSVVSIINPKIVYTEYSILAIVGMTLAYLVSLKFLSVAVFLLVMGVIYNVKPIRSKDRVFLDVLSESINNPIRFAAGWFIFSPALGVPDSKWDLNWINTFPPVSIIIAYWMGGAFLMATKRFAEYRLIDNPHVAGLYRKSFKHYTENSLLVSMFFYAITCAFFMGIFLVKDRIELLVSFPFFALLFSWYLKIGLLNDSPVQGSEKLYTRKWFMTYLVLFTILLCVLMFLDIPWLHWFLKNANNY